MTIKAKCPVCGAEIELPDDVMDGEIIECEACGAQLEVKREGDKVELKVAEETAEDWGE